MTEETQSNVVTINGKEYDPANMEADQQYMIAQLRDLQTKADSLKFQLDQVAASQKVFTDALIESVEKKDEEPAEKAAAS